MNTRDVPVLRHSWREAFLGFGGEELHSGQFVWALFILGTTFAVTQGVCSVMQLSSSTCGTAVWSGPCSCPTTTWSRSCCQGSRSDHTLGYRVVIGFVEAFSDRLFYLGTSYVLFLSCMGR